MLGRTVRRFIINLGYAVHSPAELFGRERLHQGVIDEDWLPIVGERGWVVFGRDQNILKREDELRAFLDAKIHMFLLPGNALRTQIVDLIGVNLHHICAYAAARRTGVYWLTPDRVIHYEQRVAERTRHRARRR
nr:hypothetical protein [Micromonospora sp. DSM 115978]